MKINRRIVIFSFIGFLILIVIIAAVNIKNVGYNNLKQIYRLESTGKSVIRIDSAIPGQERYLTKAKDYPQELLKSRMKRKGWVYSQQEGSGYFFEREGKEEIVTLQQWNHFYVIFNLNDGIANIED